MNFDVQPPICLRLLCVVTVRSLCCTVALLAVLVLALASACVPSCMVTVDFCAGISPSVQRWGALNWVGLPSLGWAALYYYWRALQCNSMLIAYNWRTGLLMHLAPAILPSLFPDAGDSRNVSDKSGSARLVALVYWQPLA